MDKISLRCFVEDHTKTTYNDYKPNHNETIVLVFDTETTTDEYQNLLYGSCGIWINDHEIYFYVFYADDLEEDKITIIREYASSKGSKALSKKEFLEQVFYPCAFDSRAICIGFNLPFDISQVSNGLHLFKNI